VIWQPPIANWWKVNIDGALVKNPLQSVCGGIFRNSFGFTVGGFAQHLSTDSVFVAEIFGAILAIEIAHNRNWLNLWLETDSMLLLQAFKNSDMVPWVVKNRWLNCMELTKGMNFTVTHILREGNVCADGLLI